MTSVVNHSNSKIGDWFKFWWMKVPEPRSYSLIYAFCYLGCMVGGTFVFFFPPQSLLGIAGDITLSSMGILLALGGLVGAIGGTREAWRLERIGVISIMLALVAYYVIVTHTAFHSSGYRYAQLLAIYLAFLLLVVRLAMIWRYTYRPRTGTKQPITV